LKARALVRVKLSLHCIRKGGLAGNIKLLIYRPMATGPVKDVLRQTNIRQRPLEIRNT
jgi:hypothetical protein